MKGSDVISRLSRRGLFRIKPGLGRMRSIMSVLNDPQNRYPSIHIAGTNGKGSVAAALEATLRVSGKKTGLYISPHLINLRERIQVNGLPIEQRDFEAAAETVHGAEQQAKLSLTYFEFLTAMAFVAFRRAHIEIAVIEVGLGGLWDATNVLHHPLLSIITSIGTDHRQWLGPTRETIALQKAGIIKPHGMVISGVRGAPGNKIAAVAQQRGARLFRLGFDFQARRIDCSWLGGYQRGLFTDTGDNDFLFSFGLLGKHQIDNAALVIKAVRQLQKRGWPITHDHLEQGLSDVQWPGRFFLDRRTEPAVLFDGAHNPEAMRAFLATLRESPWSRTPKTLVFSAYIDKDYRTMAHLLKKISRRIILCRLPGSRGAGTHELVNVFHGTHAPVEVVVSPEAALRRAIASTPKDQLIIVTGSLALVGSLLKGVSNPKFHAPNWERGAAALKHENQNMEHFLEVLHA